MRADCRIHVLIHGHLSPAMPVRVDAILQGCLRVDKRATPSKGIIRDGVPGSNVNRGQLHDLRKGDQQLVTRCKWRCRRSEAAINDLHG